MDINMIYVGVDSAYGFQSDVLREIDERVSFKKCVLLNKCFDGQDRYDDDKYVVVDYDVCEKNRYMEFYDFSSLIPLEKEILEKMLPYEETVTRMFVRNMEHEVYTYEEGKRLYLMHLQFWNHMAEHYHINFAVLNEVPHHACDYVIYALCKVKGIPMNVNLSTTLLYHWISGTDIYGQGDKIYRRYEELLQEDQEVTLAPDLEHVYQAMQYRNRGLDDKLVHGGVTRKQHMAEQRAVFMEFVRPGRIAGRNYRRLKHGLAELVRRKDAGELSRQWKAARREGHYIRRARLKMKILRKNRYYEKLTQPVQKGEKYVVYFLHYQPEATTLPRAGVFAEQTSVIRILAKSAEELGICVYVKEHFVQPYRHKDFYDDLSAIRGVKLISCDVDSKELLMGCVAAATCTGTVIQEALMNRKPILVFGDGGFTKGPGIYPAGSVKECREVIQAALEGNIVITDRQIRTYLKAIELETVFMHLYIRELDEKDQETLDKNKRSFVETAVQALQSLQQNGD